MSANRAKGENHADSVSIPRRVLRGFRGGNIKGRLELHSRGKLAVSIPRRVLRGFRATRSFLRSGTRWTRWSFNTPEGVEGFSSGVAPFGALKSAVTVSIPRRVLRGFRAYYERGVPARMRPDRFNTPEGVEGFSREPRLVWADTEVGGFNTPEGVEGFSSIEWESKDNFWILSFNTPEGVEGFSSRGCR